MYPFQTYVVSIFNLNFHFIKSVQISRFYKNKAIVLLIPESKRYRTSNPIVGGGGANVSAGFSRHLVQCIEQVRTNITSAET